MAMEERPLCDLLEATGTKRGRGDPPPVKRTAKKYKDFSQHDRYTVLWQPEIGVVCCVDNPNFRFLLGCKVKPVFLHRRQNTEVSLYPAGIVVVDVTLNHLNEFLFASKPSAVIAFTFQDAPKSFHWAVVNAMAHTRHTLRHPSLLELVVKSSAGILVTSVAVKQGMCVWIGQNSFIKGLVNKRIVVVFAQHIGHDAPVAKIQNGAQIEFVRLNALIPSKLGHIGKPFFVGPRSMELAVQNVLRDIQRVPGLSGAAMAAVFHRGAYIFGPADTQHSLIIDMDSIVMTQIVIEPPIALIRAFLMDLFDLVSQALILLSSMAQFPSGPSVVGGTGYMEQFAGRFNGIPFFFVALLHCLVNMTLSYF